MRKAQEHENSKAGSAYKICLTKKYTFRYLGVTREISAQFLHLDFVSLDELSVKPSREPFVQYVRPFTHRV